MDSKGCPHPRSTAAMRFRSAEVDAEEVFDAGAAASSAIVVPFPRSPNARMRHLAQAIVGYLEDRWPGADIGDCEINCLAPFLGPHCESFDLDDYATLGVLAGSDDYCMTLKLNGDVQTLLVTDDTGMMVEFACQYLLARFNWPRDLEKCL